MLFVSDTTRGVEQMQQHGAEIIRQDKPRHLAHLPYNALRYFLYLDFLRNEGAFHRVLLTDVRDVVFQLDPLDHAWPDGMNCTMEDASAIIGTCEHNAHWIREFQGEAALQAVHDKQVSCSGTTVGNGKDIIEYLELMTSRLVPYTPGKRMAGYDQGVHNVLLHGGDIPNLSLHDNHGPIMTLGCTQGEPAMDTFGFVLNEAGARAVIVHQYDRKPQLFKTIRARYI